MKKLLALAGSALLACALFAASPALAGSPFYGDPNVALTVGEALGPNYDLWAWVTANAVPFIDQAVLWLVGVVFAYAGVKAKQWFGMSIPAGLEDRLRQTALTGAHLAIEKAEGAVDRAGLVDKTVAWVKEREPKIIGKLGFTDQVLAGIALKMVSAALANRAAVGAAPAVPAA